PRQPFALAPAFRHDEFPTPETALVLPRDDLPSIHPRVSGNCPPVPHHLRLQMRLPDVALPAESLFARGDWTVIEECDRPFSDQLGEERGRFFPARVQRALNQFFLSRLRGVDAIPQIRFRAVLKAEDVGVEHLRLAGEPRPGPVATCDCFFQELGPAAGTE